jgi:hypothetical protein
MLLQLKLIVALALALLTIPASAGPLVYVLYGAGQFGTADVANGTFTQIGPILPEGAAGLVRGPSGSLLTLTFSGNLDSINPATGITTVIGATGLDDCSSPASPCGPTSANVLGAVGEKIYATDFSNNLYSVNLLTGAATLIGPTGIPALPFVPLTTNPDGSFNFYDESLFSIGGMLYANFDAATFNPATFAITPVIPANLYQIDLTTGLATPLTPTAIGLTTIVNANGVLYAFSASNGQVVTLDLATGNTSFVSSVDPAAGLIYGAAPVPEPDSIALTGAGLAAVAICRRRRRLSSVNAKPSGQAQDHC